MKCLFAFLFAVTAFETTLSNASTSSLFNGLNKIDGNLVDTVSNNVNLVINSVRSEIDSVAKTISSVTQVEQLLWDIFVNPSLNVLQQSIFMFL